MAANITAITDQIQSVLTEVGSTGAASTGFAPKFDYNASTLNTADYSVKGLSYPEDLMNSTAYGQNRVLFYINVAQDSRVLKNGSGVAVTSAPVQRDMRGQLVGQNITTAQAVAAMGIGGAAAGGVVGSLFGLGGSGGALGGALGGGAAYLMANQETGPGQEKEPTFTRPQKRLQAAIALYVPNKLNIRYSVDWGEEDTMAFSAFTKGGEELGRFVSGDGSLPRTGGLASDVLQSLAISNAPMGGALSVASGLAANPKKEQAFKNVNFRTFTFEYQFAPRSESEASNVQNIIRAFKYHMHPEYKDSSDFLYVYPSEFDIAYYKGTKENLNIHRHTSCVLTDMDVDYTPNGVFTTFENGMPTQINMTLTFKELMLLTKESIEKYT